MTLDALERLGSSKILHGYSAFHAPLAIRMWNREPLGVRIGVGIAPVRHK